PMHPYPTSSPLFPYTTLFRSRTTAPFLSCRRSRRKSRGRSCAKGDCPVKSQQGGQAAYRAAVAITVRDAVRRRETRDARSRSVIDRKSTRLNSSHLGISYAVF